MAPSSFRDLLGIPASTASTSDSALIIIDAQNEYANGALTVTNAAASGKVIANLLEKYRAVNGKVIHVLHKTPEGAPIFTPKTDLAEEFKDLKAKVNPSTLRNMHRQLTMTTRMARQLYGNSFRAHLSRRHSMKPLSLGARKS